MVDQGVVVSPNHGLLDGRASRLAMADDARGPELEAVWIDASHLDKTHPFVWISRADLGPRQGLGDRGRENFGSAHRFIFVRGTWMSSLSPRLAARAASPTASLRERR